MGARSSTAPATARVCHSSVASPQPTRPSWSVVTLTKTQFRSLALTITVSMAVIFIGRPLLGKHAVVLNLFDETDDDDDDKV